jgi:hypothetical protein
VEVSGGGDKARKEEGVCLGFGLGRLYYCIGAGGGVYGPHVSDS